MVAVATALPAPVRGALSVQERSLPSGRLEALMSQAQAALDEVTRCEGWQPSERRAALELVDRVSGVVAAARARLLAGERAAGTWALHGDKDLTSWRARISRAGVRAAADQVRQADAIVAMPQVGDALTSGSITTTHVDAIARFTSAAAPAVVEHARTAEGQAEIVALAARVDGAELGRALTRWQAQVDPAARQRVHDRQQAARYLHLSEAPDGVHVKGLLDSVAGHRLRLALEAVSPRPGLDDERTPEQRRADALVHLADRALDDTGPATGPTGRPHVSLVLTEPTWQALRTAARRDEPHAAEPGRPGASPGSAVAVARSLVDVPPVCDEDGAPWPASEVARALCDCHVTRLVVDADSVPLDLGRTQRLFSAHQRRAVTVRDGGCGWPDCGAPARWCELHHITWWDRDAGPTDLRNAVLLCSFHHHQVHRRDLTISREGPSSEDARRADGRLSEAVPAERLAGRTAEGTADRPPGERRHARYRFTTPDGRDAITLLARPPG